MAAPGADRLLRRIVVREIVVGQLDGQPFVQIAEVFVGQRVGLVLRVAENKDLPAVVVGDDVHPGNRGGGQDVQLAGGADVRGGNLGVAGVGHPVDFVEAAQQRDALIHQRVREDAEHLLRQLHLLQAVVVVQGGLRAPADVQGGVNVAFAPLHDLAQLVPVADLLELQVLDRRTGDDHPVEVLLLDVVEHFIELEQVLGGGVFGGVGGGLQQLHINLQGCIAEHPQQLALGVNLFGHEVED